MNMKIKEIIVVEGRDDEAAVKKAVDADVVQTHGYSYGKKLKEHLKRISKDRGVIILTDPDYVGKKIRKDISDFIPTAKHAFLPQKKALKGDNIGVENATPEDILKAILDSKPEYQESSQEFNQKDMVKYGISGLSNSKELREKLSEKLGIGYGNGKAFLNNLNSFGITREELEKTIEEIKNEFDFS